MEIIAAIWGFLTLLGGYFLYGYITYEARKEQGIKHFFRMVVHKKALIYTSIIVILALAASVYGRFRNEYSVVQSYINLIMFYWLAALAWVDYREKIIPNQLILVGLIMWVLEVVVEVLILHTDIISVLLFSALGSVWGGLLIVIALVVKTALGMGDAKMFLVIGLIYGLNNTYSILLMSVLIMATVSIILLLMKKVTRKTAVPMAPFVLFGFTLCIFLGM